MKKKQTYWKNTYITFLNSFKKLDKRVIYIVFCDFLFLLLLIAGLFLWNANISKKIAEIPVDLLQDPESLSPEMAEQTLSLLKAPLISVMIATIILLTFIFLIWTFFKGIIWNLVLKKKFGLKYYYKFILLNLFWFALWLIPAFLIIISLKRKPSAIFLLLVLIFLIYFTNILYILFTKRNLIKEALKNTFKLGFNKIHFFLLPYILMLVTMLIISLILWPTHFLPERIYTSISTLALVFYLAWLRFYLADVVSELAK